MAALLFTSALPVSAYLQFPEPDSFFGNLCDFCFSVFSLRVVNPCPNLKSGSSCSREFSCLSRRYLDLTLLVMSLTAISFI